MSVDPRGRPVPWLLLAVFVAAGLLAYRPALSGAFFSDDQQYVWENPYVHSLGPAAQREVWNPFGVLPRMTENYEPVHLTLHALAWAAFGDDVRGHHVVNVLWHALASWLLVLLWLRLGLGLPAAALGGALFLLHPANVEAVAWIAQLKSSSAMALSLLALLAQPRRPLLGAALFALSLLAKPSALYALPAALAFAALDDERRGERLRWLGLWGAVFLLFVLVELPAFFATAGSLPPLYQDPGVRLRSSVAIGLRYLGMAASGRGLSVFHEPAPTESWLDPLFLGGLACAAAIALRFVWTARARRVEAAFWLWAAAAWAPASGLLALPYPLADRYLYAVLPGLLGALLFAAHEAAPRLRSEWARRGLPGGAEAPARIGIGVAALLLATFAWGTHARASVWRSPALLMADSARNYPEGTAARLAAARAAALAGDVEGTVAALRAAHARGYNRLDQILSEPSYAPLRQRPAFRALVDEIASESLRRLGSVEEPTQLDLQAMAIAHYARGDVDAATRTLERALAAGGPHDDQIRTLLAELRRKRP